ncbi:peptide alpha-N-acetyltransferase [Sarocladium implicatum]|nr:peptide alpha-N-acetyltransferase [Sarocladium implicatum]
MFRIASRLARQPLAAFQKPTEVAGWNRAWRRYMTSPAGRRVQTQLGAPSRLSQATARVRQAHPSVRATQQRGFRFSPWSRSQKAGEAAEKPLSLGARLRKLSREYGKAAVGVYFLLSVLDFPFFFLLVKAVGAERIGRIEHWIMTKVIPESVRKTWNEYMAYFKTAEVKETGDDGQVSDAVEKVGWGVEEAQERHREEASLGTQLALAYAVHKSFIFVRVPLTAAVTPKIVKILRGWGWQIGKKVPK